MSATLTRRSIRKFTGQPVSKDLIDEVLKAGFASPTAKNKQLWEFVIIDEMPIIEAFKAVHPYSIPLVNAGLGILVCGDTSKQDLPYYYVADCAAATQNMIIRATELGLGTCWVGVFPNQDRIDTLKNVLNLPDHIEPLGIIALGHPAEEKAPSDRYNIEKIHYNKW